MNKLLSFIVIALVIVSCGQSSQRSAESTAAFNKDSLVKRITILASDAFGGRLPFSPGEKKTTDYLVQQCQELGLQPGNGSSYLQDVPMVKITPKGNNEMTVSAPRGAMTLKNIEDFVVFTENPDTLVSVEKAPLVFAGFGVVAPEYHWDDYAGIDAKGKVVIVMVNDPGFTVGDTTMFKGRTMTYYGRWTYKFEEAARHGAKGCLIVHNTAGASYPFSVVQTSNSSTLLHLSDSAYRCPVEGWISESTAKKLLSAAGRDSSLFIQANKRGFKSFDMHMPVSIRIHASVEFNTSHNVIAKIPGGEKPDEYLLYTAHWDHLGIGHPDEHGDSIYNGARDNASGTAAILEIARAFKHLPDPPKRSVAFLFVTGEEQGLLGSKYYSEHPIYPVASTVADINVDEVGIFGRTHDINVAGGGQSELEDELADEIKKQGRYIGPEFNPEGGHFFRSDHFSFAKVGVPALTLGPGTDNIEKGKAYGQAKEDEYNEKYYHRPSDQYDASRWNLDGAVDDLDALFQLGRRLSYGNEWPKWKPGSQFKAIREKNRLQ